MLHESRTGVPGATVQGSANDARQGDSDERDARADKSGDRTSPDDAWEHRSGRSETVLHSVVEDPESRKLKEQLARYAIAYTSLASMHARLMLNTMNREDIEFELECYVFDAPQDVIVDLRSALNAEQQNRNRFSRIKR